MNRLIGLLIGMAMMFAAQQASEGSPKAVVEKWDTYTGVRDSVTLWSFSHHFVVRPVNGLVLKNGLVEVRPFGKNLR